MSDHWEATVREFRHYNIQSNPSLLSEMRRTDSLPLFLLPLLVSVLDAGILRDVIETLEDLTISDMMDMIPTYGLQISRKGTRLPSTFGRLRRKERVRPHRPQKRRGKDKCHNHIVNFFQTWLLMVILTRQQHISTHFHHQKG